MFIVSLFINCYTAKNLFFYFPCCRCFLCVLLLDSSRVTTPSSVTLPEFQSRTLLCTADSNPSDREFKWTNQKGHVISSSSQLSLIKVTKETTGQYTCTVTVRSLNLQMLRGSSTTNVIVQCMSDHLASCRCCLWHVHYKNK